MTIRQSFLKTVYPIWMWLLHLVKKDRDILNNEKKQPSISFYSLKAINGYGSLFDFSELKGKKVMIVNTASDCGFTRQYEELQEIYKQYKDRLEIIAFPANNFGAQEQGTDEQIAAFCKNNYSITFPVMSKSNVVISAEQTPVYQWLTNPYSNGWNSKAPSWNFSKYLIDEKGKLINYFGPAISPLSYEVTSAIEKG